MVILETELYINQKMDKCLVYGCSNNLNDTDTTVQFYYFPKHSVVAQQWLDSCCVWNPDEVDINTAKICSIHFDDDSYTSEYKLVDSVGYTRVLKYDAVPTLYLPQQTIVYRVANIDEASFSNQNYETSVIIENTQYQEQQVGDCGEKYEELQLIPLEHDNCAVKVEENIIVEKKYKTITSYRDLEDVKMKNEKMEKELVKLGQNINDLKKKFSIKRKEYKKTDGEVNKMRKVLSSLETKSLPINEQKALLAKVFSETQIKMLCGKKKTYWSHDDMAVGYTIRHLSNKRCYVYLSKKLNIPLPGLSSIRRWQAMKKDTSLRDEKEEKDGKIEDNDKPM